MTAEADTSAAPQDRRLLGVLAAAFALAGAALLYSASTTWRQVTISRGAPLPDSLKVLSGGGLAPMLTALGILSLAAVVGLLATRTLGRRLVGAVVLAASIVTGVQVWQALTASQAELAAAAEQVSEAVAAHGVPEVSDLGIISGISGVAIAALVSIVLIVVAAQIPQMGAKYERAAGEVRRGGDPETAERERWKALDRGEDPTA